MPSPGAGLRISCSLVNIRGDTVGCFFIPLHTASLCGVGFPNVSGGSQLSGSSLVFGMQWVCIKGGGPETGCNGGEKRGLINVIAR